MILYFNIHSCNVDRTVTIYLNDINQDNTDFYSVQNDGEELLNPGSMYISVYMGGIDQEINSDITYKQDADLSYLMSKDVIHSPELWEKSPLLSLLGKFYDEYGI